jgi:alkylation response protein AidB-like acyl-CoA dehydrogenase
MHGAQFDRYARLNGSMTSRRAASAPIVQPVKRRSTAMVSMAKMNHTEMARQTALDARDILGGNGILGENHVMRHLCDLEASYTHQGTHDITMLLVGREITGLGAFK